METARFSQVVAKCGPPKVHTQWLPVAKDAELKAAVEDERVMTVHLQTVGSKKDHGEIGLATQGQRTLLLFPKSLRRFAGKRIVGIDYTLLHTDPDEADQEEDAKEDEVEAKPPAPKKTSKPAAKPQAKPKPKPAPKVKLRLLKKPAPAPKVKTKTAQSPAKQSKKPAKPTAKKALKETPAKEAPKKKSAPPADLKAVIRKAMKQLSQGKEVAAYQTLQGGLEG